VGASDAPPFWKAEGGTGVSDGGLHCDDGHPAARQLSGVAILFKPGLVLRTEEDLDAGDGTKRRISIRYGYTNVHAPAVAP
jgi:hypothetical protein